MGDIFRLSENTPEYYQEESLDFQLICRLYDIINNGFLFDSHTISNIINTPVCNSNMLKLLQTKLGFFTQKKLNDDNLYGALDVFKNLVYKKGSKDAIRGAVNLFSKLNNIQKQISVVYNLNETAYEAVTIPAHSLVIGIEDQIQDVSLLDELFRYILPAGIPYYIYFYQNVETFTNTWVSNKAELLFVTDSIDAMLRQIFFGYYNDGKFYLDNTYLVEITPFNYNLYMDKITNVTYIYIEGIGYTTDADMASRLIAGVDTTMLTAPQQLDKPNSIDNWTGYEEDFYKNKFYGYDFNSGQVVVSLYVSYYINDVLYMQKSYQTGDLVQILPPPELDGYITYWSSWFPDTIQINENNQFYMPDENVIFYGTQTQVQYAITYYVDDVEYQTDMYDYGDTIIIPNSPTKTGYSFSGWLNVPQTMPAQNISVYGAFGINTYTLTYNVNNVKLDEETYEYDQTIVVKQLPTKTGYTYTAWSPQVPTTMPAYDFVTNSNERPIKYKIVFNANGGSGTMANQEFYYDTAQQLTANSFTRICYTFTGWNTLANGQGVSYTNRQLVTNLTNINNATITLYAQWEKSSTLENVTIVFNDQITLPSNDLNYGLHFYVNDMPEKTYALLELNNSNMFYDFYRGDLDFNGELDLLDVATLNSYVLGQITLTPEQLLLADVNDNGIVNNQDVTILRNIILGHSEPTYIHINTVYDGTWLSNNYKTITILKGKDVDNQTLIAWLENNATQVE